MLKKNNWLCCFPMWVRAWPCRGNGSVCVWEDGGRGTTHNSSFACMLAYTQTAHARVCAYAHTHRLALGPCVWCWWEFHLHVRYMNKCMHDCRWHHDIAGEVPEKSRRVVREMYMCWWVSEHNRAVCCGVCRGGRGLCVWCGECIGVNISGCCTPYAARSLT